MPQPRVLVIGVGNRFRGDDAVGLIAAERLKAIAPPGVEVLIMPGDPAELIECWKGADRVVLIDAVMTGQPAGTLHRINVHEEELPGDLFLCSTHALGLAEAIELARNFGELPPEFFVLGIEGKYFDICTQGETPVLSWEVESVIPKAVEEARKLCMNFHSLRI